MKNIFIIFFFLIGCFNDRTRPIENEDTNIKVEDVGVMEDGTIDLADIVDDVIVQDIGPDQSINVCNDGNLGVEEVCEGFEFRGKTCVTEGFDGGTLKCSQSCELDLSGCFSCGDDVLNNAEFCDGTLLGTHTCSTEVGTQSHGQLICRSDCSSVDSTSCELDFISLNMGLSGCGVKSDGEGFCWGDSFGGGLDLPSGKYVQIHNGLFTSCGIRTDNKILCWGRDIGQASPPGGDFSNLTVGSKHACALEKAGGKIQCWGDNSKSQTDSPAGFFKEIGAGFDFTCALKMNGNIACWGDNGEGETNAPAGSFMSLGVGGSNACAIRDNGATVCWGEDSRNQTSVPAGIQFQKVSPGYQFICGITKQEDVQCWGENGIGQTQSPTGKFTILDSGNEHSCAVGKDGITRCWGSNSKGRSTPP